MGIIESIEIPISKCKDGRETDSHAMQVDVPRSNVHHLHLSCRQSHAAASIIIDPIRAWEQDVVLFAANLHIDDIQSKRPAAGRRDIRNFVLKI